MYKALVCCRAGVGSSMMLKIKTSQVIKEFDLPIELEHMTLDAVPGFQGDLIISLSDVANDLKQQGVKPYVIGIKNIVDRKEIKAALDEFLVTKQ